MGDPDIQTGFPLVPLLAKAQIGEQIDLMRQGVFGKVVHAADPTDIPAAVDPPVFRGQPLLSGFKGLQKHIPVKELLQFFPVIRGEDAAFLRPEKLTAAFCPVRAGAAASLSPKFPDAVPGQVCAQMYDEIGD